MKSAEIKKNILKIATAVFRDTQVLFAYLYGSYAVDQAHPFSDLDIAIYVPGLSQREKLDVANHIIASERYRVPKDYADSFAVLELELAICGLKLGRHSICANGFHRT